MSDEPRAIAVISAARTMLAECRTLDDIMAIRERAEGIRHYCRAARVSLELQNEATEIKLRAERRAGEMLAEMDLHGGGRPTETGNAVLPVSAPKLSDLGITKMQSTRWQQQAKVPEQEFESHVNEIRESGRELTTKGVMKLAARQSSTVIDVASSAVTDGDVLRLDDAGRCVAGLDELSGDKFGCIYADPPWKYGNQGTRASTDNHYDTMTIDQLCEMPVSELAADDAHLHLWTTNAFLFDAQRVMDAWGFEYRSVFVWVKPQMGIGNYWRVSHEFMLLGIRGDAKRFNDRSLKSWAEFNRRRHSAKPDEIRAMVERASSGPYLEMFGRRAVRGWTVFGNQIDAQTELAIA